MNQKIWYLYINKTQEGPYTLFELKRDRRVTFDTLAWRQGLKKWTPIRDIPELSILFKEEEETVLDDPEQKQEPKRLKFKVPSDELTLEIHKEPPYFLITLFILVLLCLYILKRFLF